MTQYKAGFTTSVETERFEKGLTEETVRALSKKKEEPSFLLDFRLKAFEIWQKMEEPTWANAKWDKIDFQNLVYYSAPKKTTKQEIDPKVFETFERLGVPKEEQLRLAGVAVDCVFDSVSVMTNLQKDLEAKGILFCPFSEAAKRFPDLVKKYLGSVVPPQDNFYAALNSAVFSEGSFVYIPKGVACPYELSTYFRLNDKEVGQFERTLIIVEEGASVSYLEGCTAPAHSIAQLHAAVVELIALDGAEIKYSTVQNWYPGDPETGEGGIYNFVTKRGLCKGAHSKISWTQVEAGSAITWKYPSCILLGDYSMGHFYSVSMTSGKMQADTGTKMIHLGKGTRSTILSKGISSEKSRNTYRGQVKMGKNAKGARNYTQCDSLLVGPHTQAFTFPEMTIQNATSCVEHEASTSRISEEQLFYFASRGLGKEEAIQLIVQGFCREILRELPLEFASEAKSLLAIKLENAIG